MSRRPNKLDELIDTHLGLFSEPPESEMQQAQARTRARWLMEATNRFQGRITRTRGVWTRTMAIVVGAAAAFVAMSQAPAVSWQAITSLFSPPAAIAAGRDLYRTSGELVAGDRISFGEALESDRAASAQFVLADGSRVEMRANSRLALERAEDGVAIRLQMGGIIVNAAKQRTGHLYVRTNDMTVSVVGTVFLVNADDRGSRVGVLEGEVHVREGTVETSLRPGQQVSTSSTLATRPLREEVAWSRNLDSHLAILAAFEHGMAASAGTLTKLEDRAAAAQQAGAQTTAAPPPQFEEASIRPCDPDNIPPAPAGARGGGPNSFQMTPGRTHALCMTLATLIRTAYGYAPANLAFDNENLGRGLSFNNVYGLGVEDGQRVRGGPDWVRNDRYTIDAVATGNAAAETMVGPMLRSLLERRFHLQVHVESEQIPAFDLTIAPGGLKVKEGTCIPDPSWDGSARHPDFNSELVRNNLDAARRGATTASPCGGGAMKHGPNTLFVGAGTVLPPFSRIVGAPVNDRTGIPTTARFNYVLEFAPDDTLRGPLGQLRPGPGVQYPSDTGDVPLAASLFAALERQLGLKLQPTRAPREFIMIDRVERLSPN